MVLEFRKKSEDEDEDGKHPIKKTIITLPLNTNAYVAGIPNSEFSSPQQLGAVLAKSSACQECVVKQYFRFQAGRSETAADRPLIRFVTDDFRNSGFRFKELILSLVLGREFPQSAAERTHGGRSADHNRPSATGVDVQFDRDRLCGRARDGGESGAGGEAD
jgi:hypothetical protein